MGKFIKEMGLAAMMLAVSGVSASGKGTHAIIRRRSTPMRYGLLQARA